MGVYSSPGVDACYRLDISVKALGTWSSPTLKAKAAEAKHLLPWMVHLLAIRGGARLLDLGPLGCEGSALLECCTALSRIYDICKTEPRSISNDSLDEMRDLSQTCLHEWVRSGHRPTMKFHVLGEHLVDQMAFAGNMTWTHNYADESFNFESRVRGNSVSRKAFTRVFLSKWYLEFLEELHEAPKLMQDH